VFFCNRSIFPRESRSERFNDNRINRKFNSFQQFYINMKTKVALLFTLALCCLSQITGIEEFSYKDQDNWKEARNVDDNFFMSWPKLGTDENQCGRSNGKKSPINLVKNQKCRADHEMLIGRGNCTMEQIQWKIQPWGLEAQYRDSTACVRPSIDISDSFHERAASLVRLKYPSEHAMNGTFYDGEVQISHMDNVESNHTENRLQHVSNLSYWFSCKIYSFNFFA